MSLLKKCWYMKEKTGPVRIYAATTVVIKIAHTTKTDGTNNGTKKTDVSPTLAIAVLREAAVAPAA